MFSSLYSKDFVSVFLCISIDSSCRIALPPCSTLEILLKNNLLVQDAIDNGAQF